ncbi:MAG: NAD(P)-binding domain-containing protein, partial [Aquaticitalea sp.]
MISVVLLGSGNVATHLYKAFRKAKNVLVVQWYNRHLETLQTFKNEVEITDSINSIIPADVYFIAVSDDAIGELSSQLPFESRLVVHTSGSVGIYDLDKKNHRGVFYPLQTFSKDADVDFKVVPICIEVIDKTDLKVLKSLATALGSKPHKVNSDQRLALH